MGFRFAACLFNAILTLTCKYSGRRNQWSQVAYCYLGKHCSFLVICEITVHSLCHQ